MTALETAAAGLEVVASAETFTVEASQEFRGRVSVEVRKAESVGSYIPSWTEPEEIGERGVRVAGLGGKNGVDGRISVVDAGSILGGEFGKIVLEITLGKNNVLAESLLLPCRGRRFHAMRPSRTDCDPALGSCTFHCSC